MDVAVLLDALEMRGSCRFRSWARLERGPWEKELESGSGVIDFGSRRIRATLIGVAPIVRRSTAERSRRLSRALYRAFLSVFDDFEDCYWDGEKMWSYRLHSEGLSWLNLHEDPVLGRWQASSPPFLFDVLATVPELAPTGEVEIVGGRPCRWYQGAIGDMTWSIRRDRGRLMTWLLNALADPPVTGLPIYVLVDERLLTRRIVGVPARTSNNPLFWRHLDLFDFGAELQVPDLSFREPRPPRPRSDH